MTMQLSREAHVVLSCDSCRAQFTGGSFIARRTREKAVSAGWVTATYGDRRDICPSCTEVKS